MDKNYYEELMEKYDNWKDLVKDLIIERLDNYKGGSYYLCDLSYILFESENIDGSFTYSTYWSKELIKKYWDDFNELYENYIFNYGETNFNLFDEPEKFVVIMLLEQASSLLSNYHNNFINKHWDDKIILNQRNINSIIKSMEE